MENEKGVSIEVLGTCTTNTTAGSQHDAKVEYKHLWSYAQEAALIAVSEKSAKDGCYHLIQDPERRAKRIAAHYAELYFKSAEKSNHSIQLYWPALAAFVVKDIVEAYRFSREEVLNYEWNDFASVFRNSPISKLGSWAKTSDSPYQHVIRTYLALAKGNLWLFMDIYPWLWYFMTFCINSDGTLNKKRAEGGPPARDWKTFQSASKSAVEELPFGPHWLSRLEGRLAADPVYNNAKKFFTTVPMWSPSSGYSQPYVAAAQAHQYCRANVKTFDNGYRCPLSQYWTHFKEAFYIMDAEHVESTRVIRDTAATNALVGVRNFAVTAAVTDAYSELIREYEADDEAKFSFQKRELNVIATQEQVNVLQPLIYNDKKLRETMDMNHQFARMSGGWISPQFKVIYRFSPQNNTPELETVFDPAKGTIDRFTGDRQSLPNQEDRMQFVAAIARDFNGLMEKKRSYMEGEMRKILGWLNA